MNGEYINVTNSIGAPFGGLGTGFAVYGKYGFVMPFFEAVPIRNGYGYHEMNALKGYDYKEPHDDERISFMALSLAKGSEKAYLQKQNTGWLNVAVADEMESHSYLPISKHRLKFNALNTEVALELISPLKPHDIDASCVPGVIIKVSVSNLSNEDVEYKLGLDFNPFYERADAIAFKADNDGIINVPAGTTEDTYCFVAWYMPIFRADMPFFTGEYTRYYTKSFKSANDVIAYLEKNREQIRRAIDAWHQSISVTDDFKRLWFGSLSSMMTATILTDEFKFFEVEIPHPFVNTMDVNVYSSWIYLINWPEIERADMEFYNSCIPTSGENKGFVYHSVINDAAKYFSEPTFILRAYRDWLWLGDDEFLKKLYPNMKNAYDRVVAQLYDGLIESLDGNQSYDVWKMPGLNAYTNCSWLYAVYGLSKMSKHLGDTIDGIDEVLSHAVQSFNKYLWNGEYYNCFYRTPEASKVNEPTTVFTDALFGRLIADVDYDLDELLDNERVFKTVKRAHSNNYVDDPKHSFKGWANGMTADSKQLNGEGHQYHVKTCWLGAQLNLGLMMAISGDAAAMLKVFSDVEYSLRQDHLAVGEWNYSIYPDKAAYTLPEEPCKDTPRFPPYPRYKCCWQYVAYLIGLKLTPTTLVLNPIKELDLEYTGLELAGEVLSIRVNKNWSKIVLDGNEVERVEIDRTHTTHTIEFI